MKSMLLSVAALFTATALLIFALASQFAAADEYGKEQPCSDNSAMNMTMGTHSMAGTIEAISHQTGWMKLKTGMGEMIIHYPAQTVKDLNVGDNIIANLGFTKEGGKTK